MNLLAAQQGDVQVGQAGQGLNTALETVDIASNDGFTFEAWIASAAFAGGEAIDINLHAVTDQEVDLNVTQGADFYETVNVHSLDDANELELNSNADTIATINADGDQDLTIFGDTFDVANLELFDGSAATGNLTVGDFFGTGDVTALGGSGDDQFFFFTDGAVDVQGNDGDDIFTFFTDFGDPTTFTADDSADGGAGENLLQLESYNGALLGVGVAASILNIQTIQHVTFDDVPVSGDLTVDMSEAGSATTLDLAGVYNNAAFDVVVTNIANTDTIVYSGVGLGNATAPANMLDLTPASAIGVINLQMAAADVPFGLGATDVGGDHVIGDFAVHGGSLLNIEFDRRSD